MKLPNPGEQITLPASELSVGHCVIVNECEQPCGRLVSVIVGIVGDTVVTKYLSSGSEFAEFNKRGVRNRRGVVTPVGDFGVEVRVNHRGEYWCEPVGESRATYEDGKTRPWQERGYTGVHRADLSLVPEEVLHGS